MYNPAPYPARVSCAYLGFGADPAPCPLFLPPPPPGRVGVSSEPDHSVVELTSVDKFMILASDGVWEFISSKEAVEIVAQYDTVEEACRQLVDEAYQRWLTEEEGVVDDITVVVVRFIHP